MADQRLRISAWLNNADLMILTRAGDEKSPPQMTTNARKQAVPVLRADMIQQARGLVDDMTLQRTMNNDESMRPIWDPLVLPGQRPDVDGNKVRKAYFEAAIDACHREGIQCLMSYTMMRPSAPPSKFHVFNDWLKSDKKFPALTPEQHGENVAKFLERELPESDGLSFDIEGLSTGFSVKSDTAEPLRSELIKKREEMLIVMLDRFSRFLFTLADLLAAKNKILGVATAGLTSATEVIPGYTTEDGFRLHQYTLAKGHPNVLIRAMAYDNYTLNGKTDPATLQTALANTLALHDKTIAYAKSVIPATQFQLGIKTISGAKDGVPPKYGGFITDPSIARGHCEKVLRPAGVGLALFPTSAGFWQPCNEGLNKNAPAAAAYVPKTAERVEPAPGTPPNPAHAPLGVEEYYRINSFRRIGPPPIW